MSNLPASNESTATPAASTPFPAIDAKPDHAGIELHILDVWEQQKTFDRLRARNAGGPTFSFLDGPITANNSMGVHHAWGRTLKDVYQRWHALRGFDQRYQNGFDCQGLWVEVEVEKALKLNSKQEIEAYGLDKFSRACRDRVAKYSEVQTEQSQRLGQWMDWDNDYYTLSDTNISYIWKFLAKCAERDWLYVGHRPMTWCPRCGTSLSQHELVDSYKDVQHPSLHVAFPLLDPAHAGEAVVIWTTTPWTLPANVAAAVNPTATYALVERDGLNLWMAEQRVVAVFGEDAVVLDTRPGTELVGWKYRGPFAHLPGSAGGEDPCVPGNRAAREAAKGLRGDVWRVLAWDEVSVDDGTGIVHIAPGCGQEDYDLGQEEGLPSIVPVDESGRFFDGFGELTGLSTHEAKDVVIGDLKQQGLLVRVGTIDHRYPSCWRCQTELIFRLVDEWFIACDEIRQPMIEANREVEWTPSFYGKRMEDWLNNMGDWCISRKRYWGLPLPFYRDPEDDEAPIFVVESLAHLREVAVDPAAVDALPELHRPWIDEIKVRHPETGRILERVAEVGDCWLDAGIIPFSTLGWHSEQQPGLDSYASGASVGLSTAPLPTHEEWEKWFPAELVIEMREQIRLWFYSMLFMSVALLDEPGVKPTSPYKRVVSYEKVHDETGRPMHKSWGNAIWFDDAVDKMGADVMRWQYAQQNPAQNLNFGFGPAQDIKKRFLTLWNVLSFFTQYANSDGWAPGAELFAQASAGVDDAGLGLAALAPDSLANPLDQWLAARTHQLVAETSAALGGYNTPAYTRAIDGYIEELSNWYVRRSRRRFWKAELGEADRDQAYGALWSALVVTARVLAPVMPFIAEELWAKLVNPHAVAVEAGAPDSVHLAYWPNADPNVANHALLADVAAVQRVLALGRAARSSSKLKLRQPLREVVVYRREGRGEGTAHLQQLLDQWSADVLAELSVKEITVIDDPAGLWSESLMPLLPKLGPKYGKDIAKIRGAVGKGDVEILEDGRARVGEFVLEEDEFEYRSTAGEGYALAEDAEWVIAVSTTLDDELIAEGRAREVVRQLQQLRKDSGLDISDRVSVVWSAEGALADGLRTHGAAIAEEVLATSFEEGTPTGDVHAFTLDGEVAQVQLARA